MAEFSEASPPVDQEEDDVAVDGAAPGDAAAKKRRKKKNKKKKAGGEEGAGAAEGAGAGDDDADADAGAGDEGEGDGAAAAGGGGLSKSQKKRQKKKKSGANNAANERGTSVPTGVFGSLEPAHRGVSGFCDSYTRHGQTSEPSIPVAKLFAEGSFPVGEIQEHPNAYNAYRATSEEKRAADRMQEDLYDSVRHASEVHRQVRRWAQGWIKPGIRLIDMCEKIEAKNRASFLLPAFVFVFIRLVRLLLLFSVAV